MTSPDPAWVAGVLDSLARIRLRETDAGTMLAEVSISSAKLGVLDALAEVTGVKVVRVRRHYKRLGCSDHCTVKHHMVDSETGRWQVVGARAVVVLRACRPHLHALADEADAVLEAAGDAPVKPATAAKMHELGWAP